MREEEEEGVRETFRVFFSAPGGVDRINISTKKKNARKKENKKLGK